MGGSVSAGKNNDELVDHLVEAEFIRSAEIQQVFRAVDRGNYYMAEQRDNAYRDIAWRMGNLHLSAPCVYSEVMEALKLRPGLSFLNLGSGSGYLSTMAGLILGPYGTNHGIELYSDIVEFAYERLEDFINKSGAMDEYDFCEPTFFVGNGLQLDNSQQYDRVYCGASCPEEYELYVRHLVKVGGIIIMPLNEKLLKITRTGESTWKTSKVLSVSFAPLVAPTSSSENTLEPMKLGNICPPKLKHICRSSIRSILRNNFVKDNPELKTKQRKIEIKNRRHIRRIVIPIFDESDLSNHSSNSELEYDSDSPEFTISSRIPSRMSVLLEDFLRRHAELQALSDAAESMIQSDSSSESEDEEQKPEETNEQSSNVGNTETLSYRAFMSMVDRDETSRTAEDDRVRVFEIKRSTTTTTAYASTSRGQTDASNKSSKAGSSKASKSGHSKSSKAASNKLSKAGSSKTSKAGPSKSSKAGKASKTRYSKTSRARSSRVTRASSNAASKTRSGRASRASSNAHSSSVASNTRSQTSIHQHEYVFKRKRPEDEPAVTRKRRAATVVWKRYVAKDSDSETDEDTKTATKQAEDEESYTMHMVKRISDLPLPVPLLRYLNYKRDM